MRTTRGVLDFLFGRFKTCGNCRKWSSCLFFFFESLCWLLELFFAIAATRHHFATESIHSLRTTEPFRWSAISWWRIHEIARIPMAREYPRESSVDFQRGSDKRSLCPHGSQSARWVGRISSLTLGRGDAWLHIGFWSVVYIILLYLWVSSRIWCFEPNIKLAQYHIFTGIEH